MKVLLVSPLPPPTGGIATWTLKYKDYCKENNIECEIVNIALTGKRQKKSTGNRSILDEIRRTYRIIRDLKNKVKRFHPSVVHINSSCSTLGIFRDYICVSLVFSQKIPIVFQCHCNIENQIHNKIAKKTLRKIVKKTTVVLTLNKKSNDYIKSFNLSSVLIVPNFIEDSQISNNHSINDKIENIIFVGHVCNDKGCREIIQVANMFSDIKFQLAGEISDEISALPMGTNVSLLGEKKPMEIKKLLEEADVFLFPSYREGFSIALTEAMANGLPIIASNVGANSDMIENRGGIIVPTHDVNAIKLAIEKMLEKDTRRQMSEWNINKVKTTYSQRQVMEQLFAIYKKWS